MIAAPRTTFGKGAAAMRPVLAPIAGIVESAGAMQGRHWRYTFHRAAMDLLAEASKYRLGWLWWIMEPLAMTAVFYVVFRYLRGADENFVYFLIVGVVAWLWFASGTGNAAQSLANARGLVLQMKVPKPMFPLIGVFSVTFKQAFVFAALLAVVAALVGVDTAWLALPVLFLAQLLLIAAAACSVAFLCAWLPDFRFLVASGLQLMMFCSGIFFEIASFPEEMQPWFRLNPMAVMLEQYRLVLLAGELPDFVWCAWLGAVSLLWQLLLLYAYRRFDHMLTRRIIA